MERRAFVTLWTRPLWMLTPEPFPDEIPMRLDFKIEPMSIVVVHGTVKSVGQIGLLDCLTEAS